MKSLKFVYFWIPLMVFSLSCGKEDCNESPKEDCICTLQYDPVCGCNHKTYGNACEANCAGITSYTSGECPK